VQFVSASPLHHHARNHASTRPRRLHRACVRQGRVLVVTWQFLWGHSAFVASIAGTVIYRPRVVHPSGAVKAYHLAGGAGALSSNFLVSVSEKRDFPRASSLRRGAARRHALRLRSPRGRGQCALRARSLGCFGPCDSARSAPSRDGWGVFGPRSLLCAGRAAPWFGPARSRCIGCVSLVTARP